ncbi:MAG: molybdate ABC transporter substrate-binding protein, partial [Caldilineae bacterium]
EEAARRFVAFVRSAAGQAILADFGFVQPVEEVAP